MIRSKTCLVVALFVAFLAGCFAKVTVDRRANLALPIYSAQSPTNPVEYVIVDQGYKVNYFKVGFSTDIESMSAEICSNKTVKFNLGGLHSSSPTNAISIKLNELLSLLKYVKEIQATNIVDEIN